MRLSFLALLGAGVLLGCQQQRMSPVAPEKVVTTRAATTQAQAAREVSASDAILELAALLSKNARNVAYLQQLTSLAQQRVAAQVRELASQNDPEGVARAVRVLGFADGMSRFLADTLALPGDASERERLLTWALEPAHAMMVAGTYDREKEGRAAAARELGRAPGEFADVMLGRLISDREREVSLAAMDACWDRAASGAVVDALWNKVIVVGLRTMGAPIEFVGAERGRDPGMVPRQFTLRGRTVQDYDYNIELSFRAQDADVATDLLIHLKSDLVKRRVEEMFEMLGRGQGNPQVIRYLLSTRYGTVSVQAMRLVQAYRPANVIPVILGFIEGTPADGNEQTINGQKVMFSTRSDLIGFVVALADLDRDAYHVTRMTNWGAAWAILGGTKEEGEAAAKLKAWWKENYKSFGAKSGEIGEVRALEGGGFGRQRGRF